MVKSSFIFLVTSVRKGTEEYVMSAISDKERVLLLSKEHIPVGAYVNVSGKVSRKDDIVEVSADSIKILVGAERKKSAADIDSFVASQCKPGKGGVFDNPVLKKMGDILDKAAVMVKKAVFLHRPIIVRYHNDPDGLCSALSFYFALEGVVNFRAFVNKSPYYRTIEAESDVRYYHSLDAEYLPPLLMTLDFGCGVDSVGSFELLKKDGFELAVVDHHPTDQARKVVDLFVSPFDFGGGTQHTAGVIAAEIAKRIVNVDLHNVPMIAMTADRSTLIKPTKELEEYATALDYLMSYSKFPQAIDYFARVVTDKELISLTYNQAMEKLDEIGKKLLAKKKINKIRGTTVVLVDTDKIFKEGEYPGRGAMATLVHDTVAKDMPSPAVTIAYGKHNLNIRLNKAALEKGISGGRMIRDAWKEIPNAIEAGGGHDVAAGAKVRKGFVKIVLDQILKEIEKESS